MMEEAVLWHSEQGQGRMASTAQKETHATAGCTDAELLHTNQMTQETDLE
jgi:hypothetical protein